MNEKEFIRIYKREVPITAELLEFFNYMKNKKIFEEFLTEERLPSKKVNKIMAYQGLIELIANLTSKFPLLFEGLLISGSINNLPNLDNHKQIKQMLERFDVVLKKAEKYIIGNNNEKTTN